MRVKNVAGVVAAVPNRILSFAREDTRLYTFVASI